MREEDAHAIAARLGSYERTCSTEVPRFRGVGRQSEDMMPKPAKKVRTFRERATLLECCAIRKSSQSGEMAPFEAPWQASCATRGGGYQP